MRIQLNFVYNWEDLRSAVHFFSAPAVPKAVKWIRFAFLAIVLGSRALVVVGFMRHWPAERMAVPICIVLAVFVLRKVNAMRAAAIRSGWIGASPRITPLLDEDGVAITRRKRTVIYSWPAFLSG
ncbi:MAG TPA: hypothetical protein VLI90_15715 [Tepidisphaeraceae bacterium]|nr:hypothetical protein [Tepidisphaeraceae bacterium]